MSNIVMYSTAVCPYCVQAERLLASKGVKDITRIRVDQDPARRDEMIARTGRRYGAADIHRRHPRRRV